MFGRYHCFISSKNFYIYSLFSNFILYSIVLWLSFIFSGLQTTLIYIILMLMKIAVIEPVDWICHQLKSINWYMFVYMNKPSPIMHAYIMRDICVFDDFCWNFSLFAIILLNLDFLFIWTENLWQILFLISPKLYCEVFFYNYSYN